MHKIFAASSKDPEILFGENALISGFVKQQPLLFCVRLQRSVEHRPNDTVAAQGRQEVGSEVAKHVLSPLGRCEV